MFYCRDYSSNHQLVDGLRHRTKVLHHEAAYEAMIRTDRKYYCPRTPYEDSPQPIGHRQTISAPHMHAWCLDLLSDVLYPGAKVLDVGSGSGYLSACFGHMVGPSGKVYGIEFVPELVELSKDNLEADPEARPLVHSGVVELLVGDGWHGLPDKGPFDAIHVGASADHMPEALVRQLKAPGRMVIPVGRDYQAMMQVDKDAQGRVSKHKITDVMYVPLVHGKEDEW